MSEEKAIPLAPAYWISPYGEILPIYDSVHIKEVIKHPENFGLTLKEIQDIYDEFGEELGTEGNAREKIIKDLILHNWIRIRHYPKQDSYTINIRALAKKTKDYIYKWAKEMIKHGRKFSDVFIDTPQNRNHFSMNQIATDALYNEDESFEEVFLVVVASGAEFGKHKNAFNKFFEYMAV